MTMTVRDLLAFHKIDRSLYERLIRFGKNPTVARNILSLWIWLEKVGINVIFYLMGCNDGAVILHLAVEAETIIQCFRQDTFPTTEDNNPIPFTASLVREHLDLGYFYHHSIALVKGVTKIIDEVGTFIFDDSLYSLLRSYQLAVQMVEEDIRVNGVRYPLPELPSELSRPYVRQPVISREDDRSMFITFSMGYPLEREEIMKYFDEKWGPSLERVMLERTSPDVMPTHGRIIFMSRTYVDLVLNGEHTVKFLINGKHIWARKYSPSMTRSRADMGSS